MMANGQAVSEFLGEGHPAGEIAELAGRGIQQEGNRCLNSPHDSEHGRCLYEEMIQCDTITALLRLSAAFYSRNTFLYRRVNLFLRSGAESDPETGRNLGLYLGLLRECFCTDKAPNPLQWESPAVVYRGADFSIDIIADYARRPDELIHWQGFTSSSRDRVVALGFSVTVLFEISLTNPVPSMVGISAYEHEQEVILSPYQMFALNGVHWDCDCRRWILSFGESRFRPRLSSWFHTE
jgi:hypothetical protein